jgi:capsular polysaccharide biosynthesis protein
MEPTMPEGDTVVGPMIGIRALGKVLVRKRRVWLVTALLGMLVGASLHLFVPEKYTAVTELYLVQPGNADPVLGMADDASLLQTQAVAKQAISKYHLPMSVNTLLTKYAGTVLSNSILAITFSAGSKQAAVSDDTAIGQAFLAVLANELRLQTDVTVRGLQSQISSLNTSINDLNQSIATLSNAPSSSQTTDRITDLVNLRANDTGQVSQLQGQIQQDQLNERFVMNVNHVLDPAALLPVSTKKVIIKDALSGLVAGLVIGIGAVVLGSLLSDRARDRSTVATTAGAPVELSLGRYRRLHVMRRRRLHQRVKRPTPALRMIGRRLRTNLESAPGSALAVIALGSTEPTALAVGLLALDLTSEGHRVVVVDAAEDRLLAPVLGHISKVRATDTFQYFSLGNPPVRLVVAPDDPAQMAQKPPPDDAEAVLVLDTLDPAFGAEHLASWVTDAVIVLSATEVSVAQIQITGEMLRFAGIFLRGVIVLDSDPQDVSSGLLISPNHRKDSGGTRASLIADRS